MIVQVSPAGVSTSRQPQRLRLSKAAAMASLNVSPPCRSPTTDPLGRVLACLMLATVVIILEVSRAAANPCGAVGELDSGLIVDILLIPFSRAGMDYVKILIFGCVRFSSPRGSRAGESGAPKQSCVLLFRHVIAEVELQHDPLTFVFSWQRRKWR